MTPQAATAPAARRRVVALIRAAGAVPVVMPADEHDRAAAFLSHPPARGLGPGRRRPMIERQKVEIDAEAEAERIRRVARGEGDAVLAKYLAEAEGIRKVLEAKTAGYEGLLRVCGARPDLAPALLLLEKLPELVAEQVEAIQSTPTVTTATGRIRCVR